MGSTLAFYQDLFNIASAGNWTDPGYSTLGLPTFTANGVIATSTVTPVADGGYYAARNSTALREVDLSQPWRLEFDVVVPIADHNLGSTDGMYVVIGDATGTNVGIWLHNPVSPSDGQYYHYAIKGATNDVDKYNYNADTLSGLHTFAFTYDGTSFRGYMDGALVIFSADGVAQTTEYDDAPVWSSLAKQIDIVMFVQSTAVAQTYWTLKALRFYQPPNLGAMMDAIAANVIAATTAG